MSELHEEHPAKLHCYLPDIQGYGFPAHIKIACCTYHVNSHYNLAAHTGAQENHVLEARRKLQCKFHQLHKIDYPKQEHSTQIFSLDEQLQLMTTQACDGVFTAQPRTACSVLTADCLPILMASHDGRYVAAVHAGWRGLAQGIVQQALKRLPTSGISVYIGPSIQQSAYEVGSEVMTAFTQSDASLNKHFIPGKSGRWYASLAGIAKDILMSNGVNERFILQSKICTHDSEVWPSYRQNKTRQRMASLIWKTT